MIPKFRARFGYFMSITPVTVERETESYVWIKGDRHKKVSDWESYFDTYQEAKAHLLRLASEGLRRAEESARLRIEVERERVKSVQELPDEPTPEPTKTEGT